jgi:hypothetical protein
VPNLDSNPPPAPPSAASARRLRLGLWAGGAVICVGSLGWTLAVGFDLGGGHAAERHRQQVQERRLRLEAASEPRPRLWAADALLALEPSDEQALAARAEAIAELEAVTPD